MDAALERLRPQGSTTMGNRSGALSTAHRRVVLVGTVMALCAAAAIVGLNSEDSSAVELEVGWMKAFQKQRGTAAQTKQFLAAMNAGAAAAKNANHYLGSGEPSQMLPEFGGAPETASEFAAAPPAIQTEGAPQEEEMPPQEEEMPPQQSSEIEGENEAAPEQMEETPYVSPPTVMQPAPLAADGAGMVESVVTPQQVSAAGAAFQEGPPVQHVIVQQPPAPQVQHVHLVQGVQQPARVLVGGPAQYVGNYVLHKARAPAEIPVRVEEPEGAEEPEEEEAAEEPAQVEAAAPEKQAYVMVPTYEEKVGQAEEGVDLCESGNRQSPISIEYNVVPKAMPVLGWEVTAGHEGQLRITSVYAMGADARILELVRGEAAMTVGGVRYELRSIHVHTPSEHAVGGQKFDLELQLLHTAPPLVPGQPDRVLVVSALCMQYPDSAVILSTLAAKLSGLALDQTGSVDLDLAHLALQVLGQTEQVSPTSTNAQSYWQYEGSLTTAPCSETATWIVLKNPLRVSLEDLGKIARVVSQPNRPMQPLNGRVVFDSHPVA